MQLDINPDWMSYMYYLPKHHPADPTPVNLLPDQMQPPDRYYSLSEPRLHGRVRAVTARARAAGAAARRLRRARRYPAPVRWLGGGRADRAAAPVAEEPPGLRRAAGGASLGRDDGLGYALVAAAAFIAASAAVYFVNDVVDADRDRRHPVKRNRAVASGRLPARARAGAGRRWASLAAEAAACGSASPGWPR